jgi:hypothetical protein
MAKVWAQGAAGPPRKSSVKSVVDGAAWFVTNRWSVQEMNVLVSEDRLSVKEKRRHSVILQVQSSPLSFVEQT